MECPEKGGQTAGVSALLSFYLFLFLLTVGWNVDIMAEALAAFKDLWGNLDKEVTQSKEKDRKK